MNYSQKIGIIWKLLSCLCFAAMNASVRYLSGGSPFKIDAPLSSSTLLFAQNLLALILLLFLYHDKVSLPNSKIGWHSIRVISAVFGMSLWFLALAYIPLVEAVALSFTGPIFTLVAAMLILKERLSLLRAIAIVSCFFGAFLIMRPDTKIGYVFSWHMVLPLLSSVFFAMSKIATRRLAYLGNNAEELLLYFFLLLTPVTFIFALCDWSPIYLHHLPHLFFMGFLGFGAHYSFTRAYAYAEVTFLMPFGFIKLLMSFMIGFFLFSELPLTKDIWIGVSIVFVSTTLLSYEKKSSKTDKGEGVILSQAQENGCINESAR